LWRFDLSEELERRGWTKRTPRNYLHHCGAQVRKRDGLWISSTVDGVLAGGHTSAAQAAAYLQESDPLFWSYDEFVSVAPGTYARLWFAVGRVDGQDGENVFVCWLPQYEEFPKSLYSTFKKFFFGNATCVKCSLPMTALQTRVLREFRFSKGHQGAYIACGCGYPVWRSSAEALGLAKSAMASAIRSSRRKTRLKSAGGKHAPEEIQEILKIQKGRCIYCNGKFTKEDPATKDHLLSVRDGGAKWSLNLIMACRSCNSRRCDIPFRTYCKLLSPTQNRRILLHLGRRLLAVDFYRLTDEELASFNEGLSLHDPQHRRYLDIRCIYPVRRRYTASNHLLPRTANLILKEFMSVQK
jgi:5-methylcytosine-specific restriction endonuclease McrA